MEYIDWHSMERSFMLAKRIIPCLDVDDGRVKKGVNFVNLVDVGSPVDIAASYEQQQADELSLIHIWRCRRRG